MNTSMESGWLIIEGPPDHGVPVTTFWGDNALQEAQAYMRSLLGQAKRGLGFNLVEVTRPAIPSGGATLMPLDTSGSRQDGTQLGEAFASIIGISASGDQFEALSTIAIFFAELKGYRDLQQGNAFVGGFIQGFQRNAGSAGPKRLQSAE